GRITGVTESVLTVEIADKVRVKVGRGYIADLAQAPKAATPPDKEKAETDKK
ncbi:MAG: hypothetical protein HZB87_01420, partial [Desulfatitalea sp.]|nr:hypothetical protein [Desulfatitalea sp.]